MAEPTKLRYGRARLTVAPPVSPEEDERLRAALDAYERGEAKPASVARAYLRAAIVDHSPSFSWRGARINELIALVSSASADPAFEATNARELADNLVRLRREREVDAAFEAEPPLPLPPRELPQPRMRSYLRRRLVAGTLLLAAAITAWTIGAGLGDDPGEAADEYRERAAPAAIAIADSMDGVFGALDLYLGGGGSGPLLRAVEVARGEIERRAPALADGTGDPEVDAAESTGDAYVADSRELLGEIERFVALGATRPGAAAHALYERTVELAERADALEQEIGSLGSGTGDETGPDHYRPAAPERFGT